MINPQPLVSVIMPAYNAERYIKESIDSILIQTYRNFELLIADDCSLDNTLSIINAYTDKRVIVIKNDVNIGYLRTVNKLLNFVNGDYIAFQDADDVSHPRRIELQVKKLVAEPTWGLCGTNFEVIDSKSNIIRFQNVEDDPSKLSKLILKDNPFQKPSIIFRKEVYDTVGMYREEFLQLKNISEDYDWLLRVSEKYKMSNLNDTEPLYKYRVLPTSMSKNIKSIEQLLGHKVAQYLASQRRTIGKDDLQNNDLGSVRKAIESFKKPYIEKPYLYYHEFASAAIYNKLYRKAIFLSLKAVFFNPLNFENYRLLQYCI